MANTTTESELYAVTPLMKQYYGIKAEYPDALLLFRAGDFYETFGDDAVRASGILGITLTKRANGTAGSVPLAGFPYHAIDNYLNKLVESGCRVAICEQLEDPKSAKGLVRRGVTELVTPGVTYNDNILSHKENSFLCAVTFGDKGALGAAFIDVSTGEFFVAEGQLDFIAKLVSNLAPREVLYRSSQKNIFTDAFGSDLYTYRLDEWAWVEDNNRDKLLKQFAVVSLKGFGIDNMPLGIVAAGAVLYYLDFTKHTALGHITSITRLDEDKFVWLDRYSVRNLEIFHPLNQGGTALVDILDRTACPMGARMLRRWLSLPLRSAAAASARGDVVEFLTLNPDLRDELTSDLSSLGDPERVVAKISALRATPRDVASLARSIGFMDKIRASMLAVDCAELKKIGGAIALNAAIREHICEILLPEPAVLIGRGAVIAAGVDAELDELRRISTGGKNFLDQIQQREAARTGITSLKISYNNVFGYYIEVRNTHRDKVPPEWIRKQTLVNAERYITEELKEYEEKILGAEGKIMVIETRLYGELIEWLLPHVSSLMTSSAAVAEVDTLLSFALSALENNYCRAELTDDGGVLDVKALRHPVIERRLPLGEPYIPNDVFLDDVDQQIIMITGPNMAGKSALLRSVAMAAIMAQAGSFIAAKSAKIAMLDRIFTRVGASDNITSGESTFMVEMLEAANILNNISDRSLVLLDEIGRGTSTYDGISIAWAIVEWLHEHSKAKVLFATHYHELGEMESQFSRIKNYNVSVREVERRVVFLRTLVRGSSEHSFGIHVARMAGMPVAVVDRAQKVLDDLERQRATGGEDLKQALPKKSSSANSAMQLSFFQMDDPTLLAVRDKIMGLDLNNITPLEALNKLSDIKRLIGVK
ncbi:MAG: DNA mismatch repair protein MutS [Mucinivorans sp.]